MLVFAGGTVLSASVQRLLLGPQQNSSRLLELNVGETFGAAAIVSLVYAARHLRPALTRADLAVLLLCSLAWLVPEPHAVYVGMTLAGGWLVVKRSPDRLLAGVGQVWLALSFYELWSKLIFKLFYQAIEPLEVGLMYEVGRLFYGGLSMNGVNLSIRGDWSVVMLEGCSSSHNLSLLALIWLSVLKIAGHTSSLGALWVLLVSAGFVMGINIARILLMLPSIEGLPLLAQRGGVDCDGASVRPGIRGADHALRREKTLSDDPARLNSDDRAVLAVLCLILATSVSIRVYSHREASGAVDPKSYAVDLGAGVFFPRAKAVGQRLHLRSCNTPATIYFVSPLLYGFGPSLNAAPNPNDRVFYAYRGNMLVGRFASMELSMVYVARLASNLMRTSGQSGVNELAVKIIVPAGCDATPVDIISALREQAQSD